MNAASAGKMLRKPEQLPLAAAALRPVPGAGSRLATALVGVALLVALGAAAARAGSCRVLLALGAVDIEPSPAGLSVNLSGNWEFDNLIQVASGLSFNVLLVRGDNFVRLHYPDQSFYGSLAGLADEVNAGIDGNDIVAVEANGFPAPTAGFVRLEAQRMKLTSPELPGSGPLTVLAYLVLDGDYMAPILSNTISRTIPVVGSTTAPEVKGGTVGETAR